MDFKRLGYFLHIAELGSLTKASEQLNIAQPSLSRQVRLLEEELGVELFTRRRRGMVLTDAGELLHARVTGPLRQIGHALSELRSLPKGTGGNVVLGMPPTIVNILARPLARSIVATAPNIALRIVDAANGDLLEGMRRGELDAAIIYGPTPAGLDAAKLLKENLVLVGPHDASLVAGGAVNFKALANLPLILPGLQHGLRVAVEAAAQAARVKLHIGQRADSHQLMKELVQAGLGYTILPYYAVAREVLDGQLTFTAIQDPPVERHLFLAMPSHVNSPRAVLQVETCVRQEMTALVIGGRWPGAQILTLADV